MEGFIKGYVKGCMEGCMEGCLASCMQGCVSPRCFIDQVTRLGVAEASRRAPTLALSQQCTTPLNHRRSLVIPSPFR